ncbi:hypothetical protein [Brachybacterium timonense]|uniref:hypothetical protein n=1 Tax=Brachybacterium timonense TaxID=2050896 RepID=UPI000D0B6BF9|nr:hypothetical protein [Brachybacterium timonense]
MAVTMGTVAFLCGLAERESLPSAVLSPVLHELGLSPAGARTHLSRMVRLGALRSDRTGRRTTYTMTGSYLAEFRRLRALRVQGEETAWPGAFHLVLYEIGEDQRSRRDALRRRAHEDGFRALRPGALVGAHPPGDWAQEAFVGTWAVEESTARAVIARAWDVETAAERIHELARDRATHTDPLSGDPLCTGPPRTRPTRTRPTRTRPTHASGPDGLCPSAESSRVDEDLALVAAVTQRQADLFQVLRIQPPFPVAMLPSDHPHELLAQMMRDAFTEEIPAASAALQRLLASQG